MNILLLTTQFPPFWGGVEKACYDTAKYLSTLGDKVFVLTLSTTLFKGHSPRTPVWNVKLENVKIYRLSPPKPFKSPVTIIPYLAFKAWKFIKRENIDVIITHEEISALTAAILRKLVKKPIVYRASGFAFLCPKSSICNEKRIVEKGICNSFSTLECLKCLNGNILYILKHLLTTKFFFKQVDLVIVPGRTHYIKRFISRGLDKRKIALIPLWVDTNLFKPLKCEKERLDLNKKEKIIMYVGAFQKHKGVDTLIEAAKEVLKKHDVKFVLVGDGYYKPQLSKKIAELNLEKAFLFTGPKPYFEIPQLMNCAEILVFTSHLENYCFSLVEAMACGKPVIAALEPSVKDIIIDGVNGILFNRGDPKDLASKIVQLLSNEKLKRRISKEALKTIRGKHDALKVFKEIRNLIKTLCSQN